MHGSSGPGCFFTDLGGGGAGGGLRGPGRPPLPPVGGGSGFSFLKKKQLVPALSEVAWLPTAAAGCMSSSGGGGLGVSEPQVGPSYRAGQTHLPNARMLFFSFLFFLFF